MPSPRAVHPATRAAFVVDRYTVYDEFAAGGMATVHFARLSGAHGFRRTVAAKRLLPHLTRDHEFALMLIDEARLAARIRHHNVVSTLDIVQTESELLLVMDYVHGDSLAKLSRWSAQRGEQIPVEIAIAVVSDALHGLHAAHEATDERGTPLGIVHRDVSPQNILVGVDGITRIADFGVAKAAGRALTTRDGAVKGKLAYMAPEQINGGTVSRASDVFAAAVVLWEVLAGTRLFAGESHAETIFKVVNDPIVPPSVHEPSLPRALDAVVMRGLERDPARRYASAREMAMALEAAGPSIRPSEIAGWVERTVGDRLAQRASLLSAIERAEEREPHSLSAPLVQSGPHALVDAVAMEHGPASSSWHEPDEIDSGTHRREPSQRSASSLLSSQHQSELSASLARLHPTRTSRWKWTVAAVALLLLGWAVRLQLTSSRGPVGATRSAETKPPAAPVNPVDWPPAVPSEPDRSTPTQAAALATQPATNWSAEPRPGTPTSTPLTAGASRFNRQRGGEPGQARACAG